MFDVYGYAVMIVISYVYCEAAKGNLGEERNVFKWRLNMRNDSDHVTCAGSPFQTRAAETGKTRSPTVQRPDGGTTSASHDDERSRYLDSRSPTSCRSLARYDGVRPCRHR